MLTAYTAVNLAGGWLVGTAAWFRHCEFFALFLRLIGHLAPLELQPPEQPGERSRLRLRWPFAGLLTARPARAVAAGGTMFDSSAGASGGAGAGSGATFAWPVGLARVGVQSPFEVAEVLAMALSRRRRLPARAPPTPYGSSGGVPAPPLCAPVALVFDMTSTALDGDTTTAQLTLWDIPRPHPFAAPSGGASATSISSVSAARCGALDTALSISPRGDLSAVPSATW